MAFTINIVETKSIIMVDIIPSLFQQLFVSEYDFEPQTLILIEFENSKSISSWFMVLQFTMHAISLKIVPGFRERYKCNQLAAHYSSSISSQCSFCGTCAITQTSSMTSSYQFLSRLANHIRKILCQRASACYLKHVA